MTGQAARVREDELHGQRFDPAKRVQGTKKEARRATGKATEDSATAGDDAAGACDAKSKREQENWR